MIKGKITITRPMTCNQEEKMRIDKVNLFLAHWIKYSYIVRVRSNQQRR